MPPYDRLMSAPQVLSYPPVQLGMSVAPEVLHMFPQVAILVANTVSQQAASNYVRTYLYNVISANNYNNREYQELCKLVLDIVAVELYTRRISMPEQINLATVVDDACSFYASTLAINNPQLFNVVDQNVRIGLQNNARELYNITNQISQLTAPASPPMRGYQQPQTVYQPQPGYPHQRYQQQPPPPNQYQQALATGNDFNRPGRHPTQQVTAVTSNQLLRVEGAVLVERSYNRGVVQEQVRPTPVQPVAQIEPENLVWERSKEQPFRKVYMKDTHVPYLTTIDTKEGVKVVEEYKMERNAHHLKVGGDVYDIDLIAKREETIGAVKGLNSKSKEVVVATQTNDIVDETYVSTSLKSFLFRDEAILESKRLAKLNNLEAYRGYYAISTPMFEPTYSEFKKALDATTDLTLVSIAQELRSLLTEENKDDVAIIDGNLTNLINVFMAVGLHKPEITIDSFLTDIDTLRPYIARTMGNHFAAYLDNFERVYLANRFLSISEESELTLSELVEEVVVSFDNELVSVTYLDAYSKSLNLSVENELLVIDSSLTPWLYALAETMFKEQRELELNTFNNVLVTKDSVVYQIYPSLYSRESFFIKKVR